MEFFSNYGLFFGINLNHIFFVDKFIILPVVSFDRNIYFFFNDSGRSIATIAFFILFLNFLHNFDTNTASFHFIVYINVLNLNLYTIVDWVCFKIENCFLIVLFLFWLPIFIFFKCKNCRIFKTFVTFFCFCFSTSFFRRISNRGCTQLKVVLSKYEITNNILFLTVGNIIKYVRKLIATIVNHGFKKN